MCVYVYVCDRGDMTLPDTVSRIYSVCDGERSLYQPAFTPTSDNNLNMNHFKNDYSYYNPTLSPCPHVSLTFLPNVSPTRITCFMSICEKTTIAAVLEFK
jgi:hypothetical protein